MRKSGEVALVECGLKNGTILKPGDAHSLSRFAGQNNDTRPERVSKGNVPGGDFISIKFKPPDGCFELAYYLYCADGNIK